VNATRIRLVYPALATAVLGLLVMPIALAGAAASGPTATANVTVNQLEKQILKLRSRVVSLQRNGTVPRGPAGGSLRGSYPNPSLGDSSVSSRNIAVDAVGTPSLAPGAVNTSALAIGAVNGQKLAPSAVGAATLADAFTVHDGGVTVNPDQTRQTSITCPVGTRLLSGGPEWGSAGANGTAVISSSPTFTGDPNRTWVVQGRVDSGGTANTLFAEALCLDV
jgi:hypothetical protein